MLKQFKMLSSRAAMVLVRAAENEMLQPHTGLQVQPHKDHKYRDLFPSCVIAAIAEARFCRGSPSQPAVVHPLAGGEQQPLPVMDLSPSSTPPSVTASPWISIAVSPFISARSHFRQPSSSSRLAQPDAAAVRRPLSPLELHAYSDSTWASDPSDRRSVTGYCILLGSSPLTWKSKKQVAVSRSSIEAELRALATTTSEIVWLRWLLADFGISYDAPTPLLCDNTGAIQIANDPVKHELTKHISVDASFTRSHCH